MTPTENKHPGAENDSVLFYPILPKLIQTLPSWVPLPRGKGIQFQPTIPNGYSGDYLANRLKGLQTFLFTESRGEMQVDPKTETFLDLPFPRCWLERFKSSVQITQGLGFAPISGTAAEERAHIFGALVEEMSPGRCRFSFLVTNFTSQYKGPSWLNFTDHKGNPIDGHEGLYQRGLLLLDACFLSRLRTSDLAEHRVSDRYKFKTRTGNSLQKIRKVIFVGQRRESRVTEYEGRLVNWSHAWSVRGHWRKIEGIGKNRDGDYSISGFTWVTAHTKGPDGAEIVSKIRVVK